MEFKCRCGYRFNINDYGITKIKEIEGFLIDDKLLCPKCYIFNKKIYLSFQIIPY